MKDITDPKLAFGIQVKKKLLEIGMTQTELAEELNITRKYLGHILNGQRQGVRYREVILRTLDSKKKINDRMKGVM